MMTSEPLLPERDTAQEAHSDTMKLTHCATFYPLGYAVEILTNDPAVLAAARESFGHNYARQTSTPLQVCIHVIPGGNCESPQEPSRREYNHLFSLVTDANNQAVLDLKAESIRSGWKRRSSIKRSFSVTTFLKSRYTSCWAPWR